MRHNLMKSMKNLIFATAGCIALPVIATAAITNSHHDLTAWNTSNTQVCIYCHGVQSENTLTAPDYGTIGFLCVERCHLGGTTSFPGNDLPIPNVPGYFTDGGYQAPQAKLDAIKVTLAHGLVKADLINPITGAAQTFGATGNTFPYAGEANLQCTSCHNVHNNANTPFVHTPLYGGSGEETFCEDCHTIRGNSWTGSTEQLPSGEHPVNVTMIIGSVSSRALGGRVGRYISLDIGATATERVFDVVSDNGATLKDQGNSYTTGGKVSGFTTAADGVIFGCPSCHSAHMPTSVDGTATGSSNLVLKPHVSSNGQSNPLCIGCHGDDIYTSTNEDNPGLTGFTHPVGPTANPATTINTTTNVATYTNSNGSFSFNVNLDGIVSFAGPSGLGSGGVGIETTTYRPRCTSCHDVHGGVSTYVPATEGSMAIADIDGTLDGTMTVPVCYICHDGGGLPDVSDDPGNTGELGNVHHRTKSTALTITGGKYTDMDGNILNIDNPSWANSARGFGLFTDGLQCPDCHFPAGTNADGTAHNW